MNIQPGTLINNKYRIVEKLATGGMAVVYKAKDEMLDRDVTFKVLKQEFIEDEEFIKRFSVEAKAAARLAHSNIVSVHDVGSDGDINYIVMQYIDGLTLKELIKRKAPFKTDEALGVAIQIANGLCEAHAHNVIHRDIKPQNILVTREGDIKITDFGIARATTGATTTIETIGSAQYFSPEQAQGRYVDQRGDIYSLGIVLFEMITGKLPFEADSPVTLALKHVREPIPDIKELNPQASESIIKIIQKATNKKPDERYNSAEEMARDMKRALKNPTGDFVVMNSTEEVDNSQTKKLTPEQIAAIRGADASEVESVNDSFEDDNTLESYDEYDKEKEKKVVVAAILTALGIIVLITVLAFAYINRNLNPKVKVPEFLGLTWEEAYKLSETSGVLIEKVEDFDEETDKGLIASQSVAAGKKISIDEEVALVVSLGSNEVVVPDVVGMDKNEAVRAFDNMDVQLKFELENSDEYEVGHIIRQSEKENTKLEKGSEITLYVSKGSENKLITVPDVENMKLEEASELLDTEGFEVKVFEEQSSQVEKGKVISQGVKAGAKVSKGYKVTLTVSSGAPETVTKITETTTQTTTADVVDSNNVIRAYKTASLPVNPSLDLISGDEVSIKIVSKSENGAEQTVYDKTHSVTDFPFSVNVQGNSPTVYDIYADGALIATQTEDFE